MIMNRKGNIANCSWGDHLVFGEGDGLLRTVESLERRMDFGARNSARIPCIGARAAPDTTTCTKPRGAMAARNAGSTRRSRGTISKWFPDWRMNAE